MQHSADSTLVAVPISQVLATHTNEWMKIPGVTGTGEGRKENRPAIIIFVEKSTDELRSKLPTQVEGYPVVIEEIGAVRAN